MMSADHAHDAVRTPIAGFMFRLPPGFRDLPSAGSDTAWRAIIDSADHEVLIRLSGALAGLGIVHASVFALPTGETVNSASLLIGVLPGREGEAEEVVADLVASLGGQGGSAETQLLRLPCGPAVGVLTARRVRLGRMSSIDTAEFRAYIPVPGQKRLLTVTLSTPHAPGWQWYAPMMAGILRSIAFFEE